MALKVHRVGECRLGSLRATPAPARSVLRAKPVLGLGLGVALTSCAALPSLPASRRQVSVRAAADASNSGASDAGTASKAKRVGGVPGFLLHAARVRAWAFRHQPAHHHIHPHVPTLQPSYATMQPSSQQCCERCMLA